MKLKTLKEAAEVLKIDSETVRKYINDGELTAYKIGKSWRIDESDLMDYIKKRISNQAVE